MNLVEHLLWDLETLSFARQFCAILISISLHHRIRGRVSLGTIYSALISQQIINLYHWSCIRAALVEQADIIRCRSKPIPRGMRFHRKKAMLDCRLDLRLHEPIFHAGSTKSNTHWFAFIFPQQAATILTLLPTFETPLRYPIVCRSI